MSDLDIALEAFLASAASHAPDLPANLLTKIYESQKNHQYEEGADRSPCDWLPRYQPHITSSYQLPKYADAERKEP